MKQKHLLMLLKIIKSNTTIDPLINEGLTYSQIALLINELVENNVATFFIFVILAVKKGEPTEF